MQRQKLSFRPFAYAILLNILEAFQTKKLLSDVLESQKQILRKWHGGPPSKASLTLSEEIGRSRGKEGKKEKNKKLITKKKPKLAKTHVIRKHKY